VRPEIKTLEDLRGKPLAVDAVDTAYALVLRRVLLAHGLEMERGDYKLIAKGTTEYRLDSMIRGETFSGVLNAPWDSKAAAAGMVRLADHREVLPDYPGGVFAVSRRWAAENRDLLVKYLRVWNDALGWAHEEKNRGEALRLITAEEKLDEKGAVRKLAQLPASGNLNLSGLQSVLGLRVQFNLTPPMGTKLDRYYDETFYQTAIS
jgi:ABC-type nitrate/sulfonate/bicarbonate transport system substrate-binding protein